MPPCSSFLPFFLTICSPLISYPPLFLALPSFPALASQHALPPFPPLPESLAPLPFLPTLQFLLLSFCCSQGLGHGALHSQPLSPHHRHPSLSRAVPLGVQDPEALASGPPWALAGRLPPPSPRVALAAARLSSPLPPVALGMEAPHMTLPSPPGILGALHLPPPQPIVTLEVPQLLPA